MLNFIISRMFRDELKNINKSRKILIYNHFKINLYIDMILCGFITFPIVTFLTMFVEHHKICDIIEGIVLLALYGLFVAWFIYTFFESIKLFKVSIFRIWYGKYYSAKGKALTKKDFEKIKEDNEKLYDVIMKCYSSGYCYSTCFSLLKCLEKGELKFIAVKHNGDLEEYNNHLYTFHVLYVNNGWCYDTYSMRQFQVEKAMEFLEAKEYRIFSYKDIIGKKYEEFMKDNIADFKKWCSENDCDINLPMFEGKE